MFQALCKKLGISISERRRVAISWTLRLLYQVGFVVSWTIITSLFVEKFGIENILYLFGIDALLFLSGSILVSHLIKRVKKRSIVQMLMVFLTMIFIGWALTYDKSQIEFFILAIMAKDLFFARINMSLIRQTEELFSPSEAKKVIPIIDSAITIGTIAGAFTMLQMLTILPEKSALIIWAFAACGIAVITVLLPTLVRELPRFKEEIVPTPEGEKQENEIVTAWKRIKARPFLKNLMFMVIFQTILFTFIEVEFTREIHHEIVEHQLHKNDTHTVVQGHHLQASILDSAKEKVMELSHKAEEGVQHLSSKLLAHEKLAHDLGMFHLIFGLIALFVELMISSKILTRFGVVGSIITFFSLMVCAVLALVFRFGDIRYLQGIMHGFHSIGASAYHMMFYSLFSHRRESVRLFFEGVLTPISVIVSLGILFILPHEFIIPAMLVVGAGALGVSIYMKNNYTTNSVENMQAEHGIGEKLHHIEILAQRGHKDAALHLAQELKNKENHPIIREKIIASITQINDPQVVAVYSEILNDEDECTSTKSDVLNSLAKINSLKGYWEEHAFSQHHLLESLDRLFTKTQESYLKKLIVMNIFQHLPAHKVVPFFLREIENTDDELLQAIFLRSCTVFDDPALNIYITPFLESENSRLKGAAIIPLWKYKDKKELRKIILQLLAEENEEAVISGIYSIGEVRDTKMTRFVEKFLDHESELIRLHALIALAKLGNKESIPGLLEIILGDNHQLANIAYHMLNRVPKEVQDFMQREISQEVAKRVFAILRPRKIKKAEQLSQLPEELIEKLKHYYRIAKRFDDIAIIERTVVLG